MALKRVLIIGGGFAGLSSLHILLRSRLNLEILLIDRKKEFNFLPLLPDIVGRRIAPDLLSYNLQGLSKKLIFRFINQEVSAVDIDRKIVVTKTREKLGYDYLIIAAGSQTNFYGNKEIEENALKLDGLDDMRKMLAVLDRDIFDNYIICGGGYTGIEIATNLDLYCKRKIKNSKIVIVERAGNLLGPLPDWMKEYVIDNLGKTNIEILLNCSVEKIQGKDIYISSNRVYKNSLLVWTAGVKTPDFVNRLEQEKNSQGRIRIDDYLRLNNSCFVAGDCAYFPYKNGPLRMAVQFSITQGRLAARNIENSILNRPLKKFKPVDLGYIIPMANNKSCGNVLGINVKGLLATLLHYLMCIYRTQGWKNKIGIARHLTIK